jgi:hypothetical protein
MSILIQYHPIEHKNSSCALWIEAGLQATVSGIGLRIFLVRGGEMFYFGRRG